MRNHGSRPIDSVGGRNFVRSSATPQATRPIEITISKNSNAKFVIEKPQKSNISIGKAPGQSSPKIERAQPQIKVQKSTTTNQAPLSSPGLAPVPPPSTTNAPTPIVVPVRPQTPNQVSPIIHAAPPPPAQFVAPQPPPVIITNEFIPPQPPAAADYFSKYSLLAFAQSANDGKDFNSTDLNNLGLNLSKEEPLLPMLHSVLSDAPLLNNSSYPMPKSYVAIEKAENPADKTGLFSDSILLFIFYTQVGTEAQQSAYTELTKRGYSFDEEKCSWSNTEGAEWDVNQWKFAEQENYE